MKKNKRTISGLLMILLFASGMMISCDDNVNDDAFYTFTGETVASFCNNNDTLSIFYQLIEESGNYPLLSVYGHFTCFAPTDSAFNVYFQENNIDYANLTVEEKQKIVYTHIIKDYAAEYLSMDFQEGSLPNVNLNDRYLVISFENVGGILITRVNKLAAILNKDRLVHNGVVHIVDHVIESSADLLPDIVKEQPFFSLFSQALDLTNLGDSIPSEMYDPDYVDPHPKLQTVDVQGYDVAVVHRSKFGYTILAETDDVFREAGINNLDDLVEFSKKYYGTEDLNDYTSRNNPLNKFISYHILNRQMATNAFIYSGPNTTSYAMNQRHEYYETMLKMRLIEFKAGNQINTQSNGEYVGVDESKSNLDGVNGYIHALTKVLVYDEDIMQNDVLGKRLRIDAFAIAPELTNNNIRWQLTGRTAMTIPPYLCGENLTFNDDTDLIFWASDYWNDHQEDEMSFRGWYDFTFRLPPVPPGTWEVRLGYSTREWGGITQVFFDGEIVGIPIDFYTDGKDPSIGWVADADTPDNGVENDKMMRNRGYMKGGNAICNSGYSNTPNRTGSANLRKIIGTYTFQEYGYHYFRAKNVQQPKGEFHLDYFEYVPVSYLNRETID